jgi:hypothetical protein
MLPELRMNVTRAVPAVSVLTISNKPHVTCDMWVLVAGNCAHRVFGSWWHGGIQLVSLLCGWCASVLGVRGPLAGGISFKVRG